MNLLGLVEKDRGNPEQAIDAFRRALDYANAPGAAYTNYARALQSTGRLPEARALLLARANAPPVTAEDLATLCYGLFWTNYDDDGIRICQRSIDLSDNVEARVAAALMLWNKGHLEETWQQVEGARNLAAPGDHTWAAPATFIRAQRGDAAGALAFVDSVLKQTPAGDDNLRWLHYARSIVLLQLARPADAMAELTPFLDGTLIIDYPLESQAGEILMATRNPAAARTSFDATLAKAPNFARALAGKARALAAQGDLAGAERDSERATTLTPDNADLWTAWAMVLDTAGHRDEANTKRAKASEAMARTHGR